MIFEEEGIPPEQQRLIFAEQELEDSHLLSDYEIKMDDDRSLIYVVLKSGGNQKQFTITFIFS